MKSHYLSYLTMLVCLVVLDAVWLGLVAKDGYQIAMAHIMREQVIVWPWVVFYLFYPVVILILAVNVQRSTHTQYHFMLRGAVLGAGAYGTYNLTNYALVVDWPLLITLKDWVWGTCLTAIVAWAGGLMWLKQNNRP